MIRHLAFLFILAASLNATDEESFHKEARYEINKFIDNLDPNEYPNANDEMLHIYLDISYTVHHNGAYGGKIAWKIYDAYYRRYIRIILYQKLAYLRDNLAFLNIKNELIDLIKWFGQQRSAIAIIISNKIKEIEWDKDAGGISYEKYWQAENRDFGKLVDKNMISNGYYGLIDPMNYKPQYENWKKWRCVIQNNIERICRTNCSYGYMVLLDEKRSVGKYFYQEDCKIKEPVPSIKELRKNKTVYEFKFDRDENFELITSGDLVDCKHRLSSIYYHIEEYPHLVQAFMDALTITGIEEDHLRYIIALILHEFSNSSTFQRGQASIIKWLIMGLANINNYEVSNIGLNFETKDGYQYLPDDQAALTELNRSEFINKIKENIVLKFLPVEEQIMSFRLGIYPPPDSSYESSEDFTSTSEDSESSG